MDKKTALITLLENSFWISDKAKRNILLKLDTFSEGQINQLGRFLAEERNVMIRDKEKILENSTLILQKIDEIINEKQG